MILMKRKYKVNYTIFDSQSDLFSIISLALSNDSASIISVLSTCLGSELSKK